MPSLTEELLLDVVGEIYDCALNPTGWPGMLTKVSEAVDAAYCNVTLADAKGGQIRMAAHSPWDEAQLRILNDRYRPDGIPGIRTLFHTAEDAPWVYSEHISEAEFAQTQFYREWVQPQGLRDSCMVKFAHTFDRIGVVAVVTRATRDLIRPDEARFLALLSPHFRRAALIGDLLDFQRVELGLYREALDRLTTSVLLTDSSGLISYANERAETLLDMGTIISRTGGRLHMPDSAAAATIIRVLQLTAKGDQQLGAQGIGIPLSGSPDERAIAYVLPLSQNRRQRIPGSPTAAIFITRSTADANRVPDELLTAMFGVTPTEVRVIQMIGTGASTNDVADRLELSVNTVKSHLARIFEKTGTGRQAELMALCQKLGSPLGQ